MTSDKNSQPLGRRIKRIIITAGEPAGIGPDLVLALSKQSYPHQLIVCADKNLLAERAKQLKIEVTFLDYHREQEPTPHQAGFLMVEHIAVSKPVVAGQLDKANANYVLSTLKRAARGCMKDDMHSELSSEFDAMVTAPVHKGVINQSGIAFSGHTELLAELSHTDQVVMMLATEGLRVALVTTHLPLSHVPAAITSQRLETIIDILNHDLITKFSIPSPTIYVCGLNPHAGEDGHLGMEEIDTITPTLTRLRQQKGMNIIGPLPADTIFNSNYLHQADAILGMYHDQVLPVLKYKGFGHSVNITLGLPFIRTSVDHGTALDLAGTGKADTGSLYTALNLAIELAEKKQ